LLLSFPYAFPNEYTIKQQLLTAMDHRLATYSKTFNSRLAGFITLDEKTKVVCEIYPPGSIKGKSKFTFTKVTRFHVIKAFN